MIKVVKNGVCSFSLLLFFGSIFIQTGEAEIFLFPRILSMLGIIFSILLFFYDLKNPEKYSGNNFLALGVGVFLLIAMVSAQWIGFFAMLFIISLGLYTYLQHCCGISFSQGLKQTLKSSLLTCLILYLLFKVLLQIQVPSGILV
jgi:hypothetical protein